MRALLGFLAARWPDDSSARRLLCFHHAGAGAMAFAGWQRRVGPGVTVLPVRLPGRESLRHEAPVTEAATLVEALTQELGPLLDAPYAFYGHSLGALVAYRFAHHLIEAGHRGPELLAVGACPAPQSPSRLLAGAAAPGPTDEELVGLLVDGASVPEAMLARRGWLRATVRTLRADLRLAAGLRETAPATLPCPLWAFAGTDDPLVGVAQVGAWRHCTTAQFRLRTVSGGHFFVRGREAPRAVAEALHTVMPVPRTA
ncbi:thioesterase domain-containing protein [Streptomyces sp. NPDC045470]|uniref:thioesterase II family protein n=1 Tax=unclassified Streptomyces TaxID=2593676 RepID=UPI0033E651EA